MMRKEMDYNSFISMIENGYKFKIDLVNKKSFLKSRGKKSKWIEIKVNDLVNPTSWEVVEELYSIYKRSVPTREKLNGNNPYFKAIDIEDLNEVDIINGEQRNVAQAMLELYILKSSLNIDDDKWFWQSKKDKDLIVLKKWL